MLILAIDTSTRTGSVALLRDHQLLAVQASVEGSPYDQRLFQDVKAIQNSAGFAISDVDIFAVAVGPGSFTSLRIGLTAVKAWAEIHGKPIAAISGLEAIACQARPVSALDPASEALIAPFFDARRGQIFGAIYRRNGPSQAPLELIGDEKTLSTDEFLDLVKLYSHGVPSILISPVPGLIPAARVQSILHGAGQNWEMQRASSELAPVIGRLAAERAQRGELLDSLRLDASYVRRSDAESAWKDS